MLQRLSILLSVSITLFAQTSNYAPYGFGLPATGASARFVALGQSGAAVADSISLNTLNPALWTGFSTTSVQGQVGSSSFSGADGYSGASLPEYFGFSMKFPVGKYIGVAFGIRPLTRMRGEYSRVGSISYFGTPIEYNTDLKVNGGISEFYLGGGYRINPQLSLGVKTGFLFGSYLTRMTTDIGNDGSDNSFYRKYAVVEGTQLQLGAHWISSNKKLELGCIYDQNLKFDYYYYHDYYYGDDTTLVKKGLKYPTTIRLGFHKSVGNTLAVSGDLAYTRVSSSLFKKFGIIHQSSTRNPILVGFGLEKQPSLLSSSSVWEKLSLRTGAFYRTESVYMSDNITETGISFGVGIPFNHYSSRIDCAVVASVRDGFLANTIGRERLLSFYISVTSGELWFKRFRRF